MKKLFYYQIFHIKEFSYNVNVSQLLPLLWLIYIILVFFFISVNKISKNIELIIYNFNKILSAVIIISNLPEKVIKFQVAPPFLLIKHFYANLGNK